VLHVRELYKRMAAPQD